MADLNFAAAPPEIAVPVTTVQTLLQVVAPTNQRLKVKEISVAFKGTSNTASPILVEVLYQSSAGTGGNALTLVKEDPDVQATIQSTAQYGPWSTTEPTAGAVVAREEVHPQTGFLWQAPFGGEYKVPGGSRFAVRVTCPATVSCTARMRVEE